MGKQTALSLSDAAGTFICGLAEIEVFIYERWKVSEHSWPLISINPSESTTAIGNQAKGVFRLIVGDIREFYNFSFKPPLVKVCLSFLEG